MSASLLAAIDAHLAAAVPPSGSSGSPRALGAMFDHAKRRSGLSTLHDAPTVYECQIVIARCEREMADGHVGAWFEVLASLLLGRSFASIRAIDLVDPPRGECWALHPVPMLLIPGIKRRSSRPDIAGLFTLEQPGHHAVILAEPLALHLGPYVAAKAAGSLSDPAASLSELDNILPHLPAASGIARALRAAILQTGGDDALAGIIVGEVPNDAPAQHYLHVDPVRLHDTYRRGVEGLAGGTVQVTAAPPAGPGAGSTMTPRTEVIARFFKAAAGAIPEWRTDTIEELCDHHNRYAALVMLVLAFSTGHRPVGTPFDTIANLMLDERCAGAGFCLIDDKKTHDGETMRLVPLTTIARSQVSFWLDHVAAFAARMAATGIDLVEKGTRSDPIALARAVQAGTAPLFFFVAAGGGGRVPAYANWRRRRSSLTTI